MKKKHIVSIGYYVVYNVEVVAPNSDVAVDVVQRIYDEDGLTAVTDLGERVELCTGDDALIQYEREL